MVESADISADVGDAAGPDAAVRRLMAFRGAPDQFLHRLLVEQCGIGGAERGAIFQHGGGGTRILAMVPPPEPGAPRPGWLDQALTLCEEVARTGLPRTVAMAPDQLPLTGDGAGWLVMLPLRTEERTRGTAAFVLIEPDADRLDQARRRLELTPPLLGAYEARLALRRQGASVARMRGACETLAELNAHTRYRAAAIALCDQLASAFHADRVGLGLLRGRYVKLQALSHTEKFTRKAELIGAIESAMEECVDQDEEVLHPAADPEEEKAGAGTIHRAADELAGRGGGCVLSLPLRDEQGDPAGSITLEREAKRPFVMGDVEALRLTANLCTPRLLDLQRRDRWVGAKAAEAMKRGGAAVVGPRHTWAKLAAVAACLAVAFLLFAKGTYRVQAPFVIEAARRQVIAAPFDGYLLEASVEPGDRVEADETELARLDASQTRLNLGEARAERREALTRARIARRKNEIAEARTAEAEAERLAARIELLRWRIDQAEIRSPIGGRVVAGDLRRKQGIPVEAGETLFEVAPMDELRAELAVPEGRVADLEPGQRGELAAASNPGEKLSFEIERIEPAARVVDQRNVFRVHARLLEGRPWLRPGMEGAAKVDVAERSYAWIWTRDLARWLRMKLWL